MPGSSEVFRGGVVAYATDVKIAVLDVPEAVVEQHGVVSAECARAMARGVRRLTGATYGVSTTGVAGPDEQEGKPVGTVYVGVAGPDGDSAVALELVGDRATHPGPHLSRGHPGPRRPVAARAGMRRSPTSYRGKNQASGSVGPTERLEDASWVGG